MADAVFFGNFGFLLVLLGGQCVGFLGFLFTVCGWFFGFLSYVFPCYGVCENDEDIFSVAMLQFDWGRLLMNNDEVMIASLKML